MCPANQSDGGGGLCCADLVSFVLAQSLGSTEEFKKASVSRIWLYCLKDGAFLVCFVSKILDSP